MKVKMSLIGMVLIFILSVGYYDISQEHDPNLTVFFIKKSPTIQLKFINISTTAREEHWPLTSADRQSIMDYCKYRLGIVTQLEHPDDIERCSAR